MSLIVEGVAALVDVPMPGGEVKVGQPGPIVCRGGTEIIRDDVRVGEVHAMWLDGDRVHFRGRLDADQPAGDDTRALIAARRLVGVTGLSADKVRDDGGVQVLDHWTATNVTLLAPEAAPWVGLELALT